MTPHASGTEALVHPPETSVRLDNDYSWLPQPDPMTRSESLHLPAGSLSETFRHSGWAGSRLRVYNSLHRTHQSVSRIMGFADCGARAYVYRSIDDPDVCRVAGSACHDRFCMPCTRERGQAIAANVATRLAARPARFVTLTIRTDGLGLAAGIVKLQHAFRRLLRSKLWLARVTGGAAFVEAKYSPTKQRWHPHLHVICQGRYIPHELLRKAWLTITGDSHIVRIQFVKSEQSVLNYVTTYAAKTLRTADFPTDASLDEAVLALHGTRLCRTFGAWRGTDLTDTHPEGTWETVGPLEDLLQLAVQGDREARATVAALSTAPARLFLVEHPARPPPPSPGSGPPVRRQAVFDFQPQPLRN